MHTVRQCNANPFAIKLCPRYKKPVWEAAGAHFDKISLWTDSQCAIFLHKCLGRLLHLIAFKVWLEIRSHGEKTIEK